jgi:hypothetical protein
LTLWYLFLLASIAAIVWVVWTYRKRAANKAAASSARMRELLTAVPGGGTPKTAGAAAPAPAAQPAAGPVVVYTRREHLLDPPQILLLQRLKSGLPDLEIFANVSLAEVIDIAATLRGGELEQRRRELALHCVDFLVCEKNTRIVAVVEFETVADSAKFKTSCLATAGIRHVRIHPKAIPAHQDIHDLIFTPAR